MGASFSVCPSSCPGQSSPGMPRTTGTPPGARGTDSETIVGTVQRHLESLGYQVSWGIFSAAQTAAYLRFSSSG